VNDGIAPDPPHRPRSDGLSTTLVIAAHPDDPDFGCGGTIATLTAGGERVVYCIVTDGAAGGFDPTMPRPSVREIREREQRAAGAVLGVDEIHFLGRPDGCVVADRSLRVDLARVIRQVRPDRVIAHSPIRTLRAYRREHPDHLAVGEASMGAVYPDARNQFGVPELLDEGLDPHVVSEMWILDGPDPDTVVDITEVIDRKIAAILRHRSQIPDRDGLPDRIKNRAHGVAHDHGLADGCFAEVFQRVETA
jgi:LmbE family N-acetylglucosaminyl deacetylase